MIRHGTRVLFSRQELACRGTGIVILAPGFADRLLELRLAFDRPMILTSACRAKSHNDRPRSQGGAQGHPRSLHVSDFPHHQTGGCCAVDVSTSLPDGRPRPGGYREALARLAVSMGWSVGYGSTFLHLDRRVDYRQADGRPFVQVPRFDY